MYRGAPGCCTGLPGLPPDLLEFKENTATLEFSWIWHELEVVSVSTLDHTAFLWVTAHLCKAGLFGGCRDEK